jgi:excisionase family DNA binding protein
MRILAFVCPDFPFPVFLMEASYGNNGKVICHHLSPSMNDLWQLLAATGTHVDNLSKDMDMPPTPPRTEPLELLTEQELAAHLKICRRQLYNWRMAGIIPYFKLGKAVRFRAGDVAEALERMRVRALIPLNHAAAG